MGEKPWSAPNSEEGSSANRFDLARDDDDGVVDVCLASWGLGSSGEEPKSDIRRWSQRTTLFMWMGSRGEANIREMVGSKRRSRGERCSAVSSFVRRRLGGLRPRNLIPGFSTI